MSNSHKAIYNLLLSIFHLLIVVMVIAEGNMAEPFGFNHFVAGLNAVISLVHLIGSYVYAHRANQEIK